MFATLPPLDARVREAYLARLGLEAEPPTVEALQRLARRHAERVPYETMWIHSGDLWDTAAHPAARRIAFEGRGGYCYHLNGAFGLLLGSLGYAVQGHVGGVRTAGGSDDVMGNHLALTVTLLPDAASPDGRWYVDPGLGDALHGVLPLVAGPHRQAPWDLALANADAESWELRHDPLGGFEAMRWSMAPADPSAFTAQHTWLSTSPDSGFVKLAMAERRDATGADVVHGLVLKRVGEGARTDEAITRREDWFAMLADVFGLHLSSIGQERRDLLWENVLTTHRRREEAQAAQAGPVQADR